MHLESIYNWRYYFDMGSVATVYCTLIPKTLDHLIEAHLFFLGQTVLHANHLV